MIVSPRRDRGRGVTLMEVLATMVLVAIVLPVAMQAVTTSLRAASQARHQAEAARLAENKLNEYLVVRDSYQLTGSGDFGPNWPEYRWQSTSAALAYNVYEVSVAVSWTQRGQERQVVLTTLVYPPTEVVQ